MTITQDHVLCQQEMRKLTAHAAFPSPPHGWIPPADTFVRNSAVRKNVKMFGEDLKNQIFAGDFEYTTARANTGVVPQESTQVH